MRFNTLTLALMPIAIVVNIAVGTLIARTGVPLYLDSIGTILVGVLAGPVAGGLTGLLSNVIWQFLPPPIGVSFALPFAPVALLIGLLAGLFGAWRWLRRWTTALLGGLITGLVAALASAPIAVRVFGGVTGAGTDLLVAAFQSFTENLQTAVFLQSGTSDLPDKIISFLVVWAILSRLPRRLLVRFPQGEKTAPAHRKPLIGRVE